MIDNNISKLRGFLILKNSLVLQKKMNLARLSLHPHLATISGSQYEFPLSVSMSSPFCHSHHFSLLSPRHLGQTSVTIYHRVGVYFPQNQLTSLICIPDWLLGAPHPLVTPGPWCLLAGCLPARPMALGSSCGSVGHPPWGATLGGGCCFPGSLPSPPCFAQVVSPLTEAVLGETLLTVTEEKVSITQLQAQVVASLTLSLRPSPGSSHTILATTAAQQTLTFLKQVTGCLAHEPGSLGCGQRAWRLCLAFMPGAPSEVFR